MHSAHVYPIAEVFLGSPVSDSHTEDTDKGDRQCLGEKGFFSAIHRVTSQVAGWRLVSMALAAPPPDAPLLAEGDTTLSVPCHCSRLSLPPVRRHCLLGNESGQRGGGSGVPSSNQSHKKDGDWVLGTRQIPWTAQQNRSHDGTEHQDPGCLSPASPHRQPDQQQPSPAAGEHPRPATMPSPGGRGSSTLSIQGSH